MRDKRLSILASLFAVVSFRATILHKLNDKAGYGGEHKYVDQAALMQQKFSYKPGNQHNCAYDPEHVEAVFLCYREPQSRDVRLSVVTSRVMSPGGFR